MRVFLISIFFAIVCNASALAEYPKPPIEAYGALPHISNAVISPNGELVAAIANTDQGSRMVVFDLADRSVGYAIAIGDIKARGVEFYDNTHVILRVSDTTRTRGFRGEYEYDAAFSINLESGDIKQLLVRTRGLFPAQSGLGRIVGRAEKDGEVLMPAFAGDAYSDPRLDLYRVPLKSASGRRFAKGTRDTRDWFVNDQGQVLARVRYNQTTNVFRIQSRQGSSWETIYEEERRIPFTIHGTMPDESGLVFSQIQDTSAGFDGLMKLGFDGEITGPVIPLKDREIEHIFTDNNRKVIGVQYAGPEPDYAFLDPQLQDSFEDVSAKAPNASLYLDSWSDDREQVLYRVFTPSLGDMWVKHDRASGSLDMVAHRRPDVPAEAIGDMLSIEYKARDGLTIPAIVTLPPLHDSETSPPLPAIVIPHGGPASYDQFDFDWMAQYFANRGYLILQPNFRGSTGFGRAFEDAGRGEWGGKMQDDITDGVNALVTAKMVDPDRVCIAGASYGGYAALAGAVFTPELYQCVIAIAPVSDLNKMLRDEKRDHGRHHWVISYWEDAMADGDARRDKLRAISPVRHAENVIAPVLLIHGDDDTVVPFDQSTVMRNALRRADKQVELIKLKGEDHWLSVAETRLQTLQAMDAFISEHLPLTE